MPTLFSPLRKSLQNWRFKLGAASFLIIIVGSSVGYAVDKGGFLGNLLAEIVGLFLGIIATLLIVEAYADFHKEKQWSRVRRLTYGAVAAHLCDLAVEMMTFFTPNHRKMGAVIEGRLRPNPDTIAAMDDLISQLRQLPNMATSEESTSDLSVEFYEKIISWDLDQIQNVLTPRIMHFSTDQQVINALFEFNQARRDLHNAVIAHKTVVTHNVFPVMIRLLVEVKALYSALCDKWIK